MDKQGLLEDSIFGRTGLVCSQVKGPGPPGAISLVVGPPVRVACKPDGVVDTTLPLSIVAHGGETATGKRIFPSSIYNRWFRVGGFTVGGVRDVLVDAKFRLGLGMDVTFHKQPSMLDPLYGKHPISLQVFMRLRPASVH